MNQQRTFIILIMLTVIPISCKNKRGIADDCDEDNGKLFSLLPSTSTGISFRNDLSYTEEFNTYTYRNFYNGGGVAIGDINNDGLQDVFFSGNMVSNKLYLNQGNFKFRDVTNESGLNSLGVWSTGVSLIDVNGDGWLDIYICKSGKPGGEKRHNELFINQGLQINTDFPVFKEMAEAYGIDDYGLSTHSAFFDYDKDGDLDLYLLNNSIRSVGKYDLKKDQRMVRDPNGGNKLYRNDGDFYTDVSESAGIYGSAIGFGLGVTIGDVNKDGWQDIFVSNDFFEKDYLYLNNADGTFTESLETVIGEISLGSMGADMADINNDGFPEIFVTEMLPKDEARLKTKTIFEDWNKYRANLATGYYRQFSRNVLQLNQGYTDQNQKVSMAEIARFSGVEATDWSWGALIADLDNDGLKDLFVANGIFKDLVDLDYINFYADPLTTRRLFEERGGFLKQLIDSIPSNPIPNVAYKNNGDLTFSNITSDWGLGCKSFSNGSAYGDLDNDGDLDLVVNNVNMPAFVYRNNADTMASENHFLNIQLKGNGKNTAALGAQVTLYTIGGKLYQELAPMRGYQSSVDNRLNFGLGKIEKIDSVLIQWPDLTVQVLRDVRADQFLKVEQDNRAQSISTFKNLELVSDKRWFAKVKNAGGLAYTYHKSAFNDFDRDPLLYHMESAVGSSIAVADINGDGRQDVYLGGDKGNSGSLYIQTSNGHFLRKQQKSFEKDRSSMDTSSAFFDADNDGDLDLYVCSGGNEFPPSSSSLIDRLYFNDGNGNFIKSEQVLPTSTYENTSCVRAADFDGDGDLDLFVGVRSKAFSYGIAGNGYILRNNGFGVFENITSTIAKGLVNIGMITDAQWFDHDGDGDQDLVLVGDWMPITVFENQKDSLVQITKELGLGGTNGFWKTVEVADLDLDGDLDLIAGNLGLNSKFRASEDHPIEMYVNDFDKNGKLEQIITVYKGDKSYPIAGRTDLLSQLPYLKRKYLKFNDYKEQTVLDIFGPKLVEESQKLRVNTTAHSIFLNNKGSFQSKPLPAEAQFAPVYAIEIGDFDYDKIPDIVLGGNFYWSKPEVGIYDASKGNVLKGMGKGNFQFLKPTVSGLFVKGEIRDIKDVHIEGERVLLISRINDSLIAIKNDKR